MSPLIVLLVGCDEPEPPASPPPLDLSEESEAFRSCITQVCSDGLTDAATLDACRADICSERPEAWALSPGPVRYSDGILSVEVAVKHSPGGHGPVDVPHEGEVWLGVTVLTDEGKDIDLAVQTVFSDRLNEPFVFSSEVGEGVRDIIFGLWGKRIEPCDVARSGCQMFGFVLDESLAAWPPLTYTESPPRRQRILTESVVLSVVNAGAPLDEANAQVAAVHAALNQEAGRFGASVALVPMTLAETAGETAVEHANDHDGPIASLIAPAKARVSHAPDSTVDFVLTIGGTAERLACMQERCTDLSADCDCP